MKVTTDGCLLGAIVAAEIRSCDSCSILDIGAGTGLLSLMLAQQNLTAMIDAIEIDEAAAQQATKNVAASPWAERIKIMNGDILNYASLKPYDVIISNPPFYEKQLASPNAGRRQAHHSSELTLQQLMQQAIKLLKPHGKFFVIMPYFRTAETMATAAAFNLQPENHWLIRQTPTHNFFRSIFCFSLQCKASFQPVHIYIKDEQKVYSEPFRNLLYPYYLKSQILNPK